MVLASVYGTPPSDEERFRILDRAVELGKLSRITPSKTRIVIPRIALTHDSIYGDNEEMLGKWFELTGKRDEIFLASKFGIMMENLQFKGIVSSGEYCKQACKASLKKQGTDSIDLCEFLKSTFRGCYPIYIHSYTNFNQITPIVFILGHQLRRQCEHWLN